MENYNNEEKENLNEENADADESSFAYRSVLGKNQNSRLYSVISVCLSALSLILEFIPWLAFISGALGILFAIISRKNLGYFDNISLVGLIMGIFGTVFSLMGMILIYFLKNTEFFKNLVDTFGNKK